MIYKLPKQLAAGILLVTILAFFLGVALSGCAPSREIQDLQAVEVRDYQGEKLSSIADFRENSIAGPQKVDLATYRLVVDGLVSKPLSFTYDEVLANFTSYRKVLTLHCVEGWDTTVLWEGPRLSDLLQQAGVLPEAKVLILHAVDGYSTSFPLSYLEGRDLLLADRMNQVRLPAERGFPFQLVAEDKWGYKWIKWVTRIELSSDTNYKGYWESRGYSNEGDLVKPYFP